MFKYRNPKDNKKDNENGNALHPSLKKDQRGQPRPIRDLLHNNSNSQQIEQSSTLSESLKEMPGIALKKVFLVFSRMHWGLKLRHKTLFLAVEIYLKYMQGVSKYDDMGMPLDCLLLVCGYLAMKY